MSFINDETCLWNVQKQKDCCLFFRGDSKVAQSIHTHIISSLPNKLEESLVQHLKTVQDFTSGVFENDDYLIAWVDHIRSWPIFYTHKNKNFIVSNNARQLVNADHPDEVDVHSCVEFSMSGYVSGKRTIYKNLYCLQPGELLIYKKRTNSLQSIRYFQYTPSMTDNPDDISLNLASLGRIIDEVILKIIERANNRPIWVPLSGGLDSRIILCKLHEHGYKNIYTFTYGPKFNFESKYAKKIANKLGVPWIFISPTKKKLRHYFTSKERRSFWDNTDGFKAIPSMREFSALMYLREKKLIPDDAILINGQSGDYITGGHVSKLWFSDKSFNKEDLLDTILGKHYSLWEGLKTENYIQAVKHRIAELLPSNWESAEKGSEWASLEETWEYEGRQICLVANGQRSYDFFGYDWEMPLWEKKLVDFCEGLSLEQKNGQSLYKRYLQSYNYKGLFPSKEPYIWRWPTPMLWVIPLAQVIGFLKGKRAKHNFYALMRYHGHYSNQFYSFPWSVHRNTFLHARNVMSLNVRQWAIENHDVIPRDVLNGLMVENVG